MSRRRVLTKNRDISPEDMSAVDLADYLAEVDHDMFNADIPYFEEAIKRLRILGPYESPDIEDGE